MARYKDVDSGTKLLAVNVGRRLRILWAILTKGEDYDPNAWLRYAAKA